MGQAYIGTIKKKNAGSGEPAFFLLFEESELLLAITKRSALGLCPVGADCCLAAVVDLAGLLLAACLQGDADGLLAPVDCVHGCSEAVLCRCPACH
jgi:hypothetical protein